MESSERVEMLQAKKIDHIEVSYTVLAVNDESSKDEELLQKIAASINVQLAFEQESQKIPFVRFNDFEKVQYRDKLFLYGTSGCGKSRNIFEIVKEKIERERKDIGNIYIINPRHPLGDELTRRADLYELIGTFSPNDVVIWDNYPDGLVKRDVESAQYLLEVISSKDVKALFVALKPNYLEIFRDIATRIQEIYEHEISYDKQKIKNIIKLYGTSIASFKELYEKYMAKDIDKISRILWQKEPIPLTVLDYYKELRSINNETINIVHNGRESREKRSLDGISTAEKLLLSTDYYEHQFAVISNSEERQSDADFLYTVKLCYELGLTRTIDIITKLQRDIFGTVPPKEPLQKLAIWLYLSSQYYAMHDLCKDAIKFNDDVRLKIINHLTENFMNIGPSHDNNSAYSFGIFYGKNFQFVPHADASNPFLPAHIYGYMKTKRYFEKGLGYGIGEIFPLLDEELQEEILRRIEIDDEFAESFGEKLGDNFASLDELQQKMLLEYKNKSAPFASGLGEGLGYNLKSISPDLQKKIFELCSTDAMFAQGIGRGLGRNFKNLSKEFQEQVFAWTEEEVYGYLREGLAIGIGRSFAYLDKQLQQEILKWAETDGEFAEGLGHGLGYDFPIKDKQSQEKIFAVARGNFQIAFGLVEALGFNFTYVDKTIQKDLLKRAEKHVGLANALGDGFGKVFSYLDKEMQLGILTQAKQNAAIAWGLGHSLGQRFKYTISIEFKKELFRMAEKNVTFARGFGQGLGNAFSELDSQSKKELFDKAEKDSELAFGLGAGIASWQMENELQKEVITKAEKNSQFARGLAQSLAMFFAFLDKKFKETVLELAEKDSAFAYGYGRGSSLIFFDNPKNNDVSEQIKREVFERLEKNSQFATGLASRLGVHIQDLSNELQKELFEVAKRNTQFAYGLGYGLGHAFAHLEEKLQKDLFRLAEQNVQFAKGFGSGLGYMFMYLDNEFQKKIFQLAEQNLQFARGLGQGLGTSFMYFEEDVQAQVFEKATATEERDSAFTRGLGEGLGCNFPYLPEEIQTKVFRKADENMQFRIGLGSGLGFTFPYLEKPLQIKIFERAELAAEEDKREDGFTRGLGEGLSSIFRYLSNQLQSDIFKDIELEEEKESGGFAKGLGFGFGQEYKYLNKEIQAKIFEDAQKNLHFSEGLGSGLGSIFPYLEEELQEEVFTKSRILTKAEGGHFAYGLGKGLAYILASLPKKFHARVLLEGNQNDKFAKGLGEVLGHIFPSLGEELQEEILLWADGRTTEEFSEVLGLGIGYIFNYLDDIIQEEIFALKLMEKSSAFARGLGEGLGCNFPSLSDELQNVALAERNIAFSKGLRMGLGGSFQYLDKRIQDQILALTEKSQNFAKGFQDSKTIITQYQQSRGVCDDFPIIGFSAKELVSDASVNNIPNKEKTEGVEEVAFSGRRESYCVCYIDMMNSTKIAAELSDIQVSKYYAIFLNSMATIARNFGAKIIKNAGDCLIFYFPQTSSNNASSSSNSNCNNVPSAAFKDVIECCLTMIAAHRAINAKLHSEQLPPLNYRISADYGKVEIAKSASSQREDLFGSIMNICAKINSKAAPNGIVIGNNMYLMVKSFENIEEKYIFEKVGEYSGFKDGATSGYAVYSVKGKQKRIILNPFKRASVRYSEHLVSSESD